MEGFVLCQNQGRCVPTHAKANAHIITISSASIHYHSKSSKPFVPHSPLPQSTILYQPPNHPQIISVRQPYPAYVPRVRVERSFGGGHAFFVDEEEFVEGGVFFLQSETRIDHQVVNGVVQSGRVLYMYLNEAGVFREEVF